MPFPKVTLGVIRAALISGFDGLTLSDGTELAADNNPDSIDLVSDDRLPFLLFDIGNAQTSPWQAWQDTISWDIPATIKVKAPADVVDDVLVDALQDLMQRTKEIIGLPVDEDGQLTPYSKATASLFDQGKLRFLAERGAPFFRGFTPQLSIGNYATATVTFHVESTIDLDPRGELPVALQIRFGIIPMSGSLAQDPTLPEPYGIPITPRANFLGLSKMDGADPLRDSRQPPLPESAGVADADQVVAILAQPYAAALSAGSPTTSLIAIARYANWNTVHVERLATWTSTNPAVATVDATGVVTRVSAGASTVSCTLNGVPSNGVAITCT